MYLHETHKFELKYIEKQKWFLQFLSNATSTTTNLSLGSEFTILETAFDWNQSSQGYDFWNQKNSEIKKELAKAKIKNHYSIGNILAYKYKDRYLEYFI